MTRCRGRWTPASPIGPSWTRHPQTPALPIRPGQRHKHERRTVIERSRASRSWASTARRGIVGASPGSYEVEPICSDEVGLQPGCADVRVMPEGLFDLPNVTNGGTEDLSNFIGPDHHNPGDLAQVVGVEVHVGRRVSE